MRRSVRRAAAVVAIGVVAALVAPAGTVSPATASASTTSVAYQKLPDGRTVLARWNPCQSIVYRVNPVAFTTSAARNAAIKDVQAAVAKLSAQTGMTFRYAGVTTQIPRNTSSKRWHQAQTTTELLISWVDQTKSSLKTDLLSRKGSGYAAGTGGYAYKYWKTGSDPWKGATGRGFVVLDVRQNSKFKAGFGSGVTRGSLLLHEIAHSVGLLHVGASSQQMYPTVVSRSAAGYNSGDITGLRKMGKPSGCISVPSWVWTDLK